MQEFLNHLWGYFTDLSNIIHPIHFVVDIIVCTLLSMWVGRFYIRYGNAISNRNKFAANFVPLALTTMSIMVIVKPSVALSLGLVGALSIVRFRAAIKDPEELTYLFLVIAIGLGTGADQPLIAIMVISFILLFLYLSKRVADTPAFKEQDRLYVNITTDTDDLKQITNILKEAFVQTDLKRLDTLDNKGLDLSYICRSTSIDAIDQARKGIQALSQQTKVSIIDQPDLII